MTENNTEFWDKRNMFSSCSRRILHDPECESVCCSNIFENHFQSSSYDDMTQQFIDAECNSVESILTPTTSENEFLYNDANISYAAQVPEYPEVISHSGMVYTEYSDVCQVEVKRSQKDTKRNQDHCKGVVKRKRKRTVFTTDQIIAMEGVFKKRPYVSKEERLFLTKKLNISEKAIKVWFQNRRRVTEKKEKDQCDSYTSDSTTEDIYDDHKARLDYIESQIKENTDAYGFVTLSNKTISELIKVIDAVLSHRTDCGNAFYQKNTISQRESYLMYEPISPESISDETTETENILTWKPTKPEESLQRLIDIQTLLYM